MIVCGSDGEIYNHYIQRASSRGREIVESVGEPSQVRARRCRPW